ncbi:MAG TPA: hypothetical protein VKX17_11880 [Planctomycetota bacterium]|nr:hypothetical protein [Planctomycetota bacterium]
MNKLLVSLTLALCRCLASDSNPAPEFDSSRNVFLTQGDVKFVESLMDKAPKSHHSAARTRLAKRTARSIDITGSWLFSCSFSNPRIDSFFSLALASGDALDTNNGAALAFTYVFDSSGLSFTMNGSPEVPEAFDQDGSYSFTGAVSASGTSIPSGSVAYTDAFGQQTTATFTATKQGVALPTVQGKATIFAEIIFPSQTDVSTFDGNTMLDMLIGNFSFGQILSSFTKHSITATGGSATGTFSGIIVANSVNADDMEVSVKWTTKSAKITVKRKTSIQSVDSYGTNLGPCVILPFYSAHEASSGTAATTGLVEFGNAEAQNLTVNYAFQVKVKNGLTTAAAAGASPKIK